MQVETESVIITYLWQHSEIDTEFVTVFAEVVGWEGGFRAVGEDLYRGEIRADGWTLFWQEGVIFGCILCSDLGIIHSWALHAVQYVLLRV